MLSQSDLERERYLARQRIMLDEASLARELRELREAAEAAEKAAEKGELIGRIHLSQRVLKQPQTPRQDLLGRSVEELTRLADDLEAKLTPSVP